MRRRRRGAGLAVEAAADLKVHAGRFVRAPRLSAPANATCHLPQPPATPRRPRLGRRDARRANGTRSGRQRQRTSTATVPLLSGDFWLMINLLLSVSHFFRYCSTAQTVFVNFHGFSISSAIIFSTFSRFLICTVFVNRKNAAIIYDKCLYDNCIHKRHHSKRARWSCLLLSTCTRFFIIFKLRYYSSTWKYIFKIKICNTYKQNTALRYRVWLFIFSIPLINSFDLIK